ncbi:MAG: V-type ATPase subunit subunit G family protein [Methanoregula sp.]|nr:V-type ATPase subunit subunit G family protein [Methanoregula sp.]MDD5187063.1 V-type ATPase subunit subunit G family protein [Methanoregula sp.]
MTTEKTLLQQIREKELLINIKIEDTRREADEAIRAAEKQASERLAAREQAEAASARSCCERERGIVKHEIEQMRADGDRQARAIREAGERNLPRATEKIVQAVTME